MEDNGVHVLTQLGEPNEQNLFKENDTNYLHENEPVSEPKSIHHNRNIPTVGAFGTTTEDQIAAVPSKSMRYKNINFL